MRSLACPHCGQRVFFENSRCLRCHQEFGFDPSELAMRLPDDQHRACANRGGPVACNWLLTAHETGPLCRSCILTRTIPDLSQPDAHLRLQAVEQAKRRALYAHSRMGLDDLLDGMVFDVLADPQARAGGPPTIPMGHSRGLITLNLEEADPGYRARTQVALDESYRTVLGHIRHETGHYFWPRLVGPDAQRLQAFRELFGDERRDYGQALAEHYARSDARFDRRAYVSAYAGSHPLEDWAETWAHLMHILDTVESAGAMGIVDEDAPGPPVDPYTQLEARPLLERFRRLTAVLNELNRALGQDDAYPFALGDGAMAKLTFIHGILQRHRAGVGG
ncbi:MAG TPA: putative zinc-binding metallopeptidase [Pseudomonadales bacterium]|nr:putative zinc-binding metallopeptidase [Pseudomonadales bacterium]